MEILVLAGGGIDSTVCVHLLVNKQHTVRMLHIDFGQKAAKLEWLAVQRIANHYGCENTQVSIYNLNTFTESNIHGRNATFIFLGLMALKKEESGICLGIHSGTNFYDCSELFFKQAKKILQEYTDARIALMAPLLRYNKQEVIKFAEKHIPIDLTYSCQEGTPFPCGVCHSCIDRRNSE
jgi:7-cyano-7-deazaguanine synthase